MTPAEIVAALIASRKSDDLQSLQPENSMLERVNRAPRAEFDGPRFENRPHSTTRNIQEGIAGILGGDDPTASQFDRAGDLMGLAALTPGLGNALFAIEAAQGFKDGNTEKAAFMAALQALPLGVGLGLRKFAKTADDAIAGPIQAEREAVLRSEVARHNAQLINKMDNEKRTLQSSGKLRLGDARISTAPSGAKLFDYKIIRNGEDTGLTASGFVRGDRAEIDFIGNMDGGANSIGIDGIRQIREAFRRDFPSVKVFSGQRATGARKNSDNITQEVVMPGLAAGFSLGGIQNQEADEILAPFRAEQ